MKLNTTNKIRCGWPKDDALSDEISKDLKTRGFKVSGSTIVYAHMQAIGMVNDHTTNCFRHKEA